MKQNTSKILRYIFAAVLVVVSFYFVFKDIDFEKLVDIFKNADYIWVFVSIPVILASHFMRAIRWRVLLKPILKAKNLTNLFSAVMVGYAVNNVLPRGGEFVRPFVYARRENVSKSSVFATIIVERVIDVIFLLGLFAIAFFLMRDEIATAFPVLDTEMLIKAVILPVVLLITLILLALYTSIGEWMLKTVVKPLSEKFYVRASDILKKFLKGFEFIRTPTQYLRVTSDSTIIWILYALPLFLMFNSFEFQSYLNLGLADAGLLLIVTGIGVTIAPTPGAIGVYHYLVVYAMTHLYTITREEALAFATLVHALNLIIQVVVGSIFLLRENISKIPSEEEFDLEEPQSSSAGN